MAAVSFKEEVKETIPEVVLVTDIGSADNDDFFAILYAIHLAKRRQIVLRGIIAVHHYAEDRARMLRIILAESGLGEGVGEEAVPVHVGTKGAWPCRLRPDKKYTEEEVVEFEAANCSFPTTLFGHPAKGTWFANFGKAMQAMYPDHPSWTAPLSPLSGSEFIEQLAKLYSPSRRLRVICLAPPHDLVGLSAHIHERISITTQNGGIENIDRLHSFLV